MFAKSLGAALALAAVAAAKSIPADALMQGELTMDQMEELYTKVTGPYCDEFAYIDPLCSHRRDELLAEASLNEWAPPKFEKLDAYCSRFPDACDSANRLRINTDSRFLVDSYGRTTLLHGVNAIYKVDPYIPS